MKLCASNIAWSADDDVRAQDMLQAYGVSAIEVAPTRIWPLWEGCTEIAARRTARKWTDAGLPIVSLQSILYGVDGVQLFGTESERGRLRDAFVRALDVAAWLGASHIVYGSPGTRDPGTLSADDAVGAAAEFFADLAPEAEVRRVNILIEPCPRFYGCRFVTRLGEALDLTDRVGSTFIRPHVDAGELEASRQDGAGPEYALARLGPGIHHVHASIPGLGALEETPALLGLADHLKQNGYDGYVSLEMRPAPDGLVSVARSLAVLRHLFGDNAK